MFKTLGEKLHQWGKGCLVVTGLKSLKCKAMSIQSLEGWISYIGSSDLFFKIYNWKLFWHS